MPAERLRAVDRLWVAAYEDDMKVVYDVTSGELRGYNVARDPGEATDLLPEGEAPLPSLVEESRRVAETLRTEHTEPVSKDVEERLRSWGYL